MSRYSSHDHYLDPASGVLKNRLGITDAATLEKAEAALVATRSYELSQTPLKGRFDLTHLQASIEFFKGDTSKLAALIRQNLNTLDPGASTPAQGPKQMLPKRKLP